MAASQCALVMEGGGAREFARSSWNAKRATVVRRRRAGAPGTVGTRSHQHHAGLAIEAGWTYLCAARGFYLF